MDTVLYCTALYYMDCTVLYTHLDVRPGVLPDLLDLAALLPDDAAHDGLVDQQPQLPLPAILLINAETHYDDNITIPITITIALTQAKAWNRSLSLGVFSTGH